MRTAGRFTLFGFFTIVGVGLAVYIGLSTEGSKPSAITKSADSAVTAKTSDAPSLASAAPTVASTNQFVAPKRAFSAAAVSNTVQSPKIPTFRSAHDKPRSEAYEARARMSGQNNLSAPRGPALVEPNTRYAQQTPPPSDEKPMPPVLNVLQNGENGQPTVVPLPPPPGITLPPTPAPQAAGTNIQRTKALVNGQSDGKLRIHIYDEDIRKVLDLLSERGNLNILASKSVEGKVSASLNGVDIDSALRAILKSTGFVSRREGSFIFVGTPDEFTSIEQGMDRVATRVYHTNYITAKELQTLVAPLLTDKIGIVSVSTPSEAGIGISDSNGGANKFSGGEVLVVRDYGAVLQQIDQLVSEVDVRPLQVAIEAMILSVKLEDTNKFGVNFQLLKNNKNIAFGLGSPYSSLTDFSLDGGLKFGFLDGNLGAFIEALEQVGDTSVVSNPRLMVLNKQRAEIQIGEKKGYISQTVTETSSTKSVEFLDIGSQLRLRPFISSDGLIRMEVHPELSDGDVKVEQDFTLPNKEITQVTTNIMVRDGCTVVIGGLIREQLATTTTQIPVLGNLPVVGFVFRQSTETTERREVLVLITPRIVYEPGTCQEGDKQKCEFLRRQDTYADKMSPFGKRSIARRYYRLAERAYAEGNMDKALRFAEMSVQFDPLDRSALELRSNIWLGKPYAPPCAVGQGMANPMEGATMADWIINDLESAPPAAPAVQMHPLDPGIPGKHSDLVRPRVLQ